MLSFGRKAQPLLGVDISSSAVKLIELSHAGNRLKVEHYGIEPLPPNAVVEKAIADVPAVGDALRQALKQSGTKNRHCAMAVPSSAVITKVITMPSALKENELEGQIRLEADQYIPYALDEVKLDFEVLGITVDNPQTVDVLLSATRSENVEARVAVAKVANLTPQVMDVEGYSIERAYTLIAEQSSEGSTDKAVGIIDVGATMTSLAILADQKMIYTREQPFGGRQLTEEIMRRYNLTYEQAGRAKKEGGLPDDYVPEVLNPFRESIAQQISRLLQFFHSSSLHSTVEHLILCGGCAAIPGIDEHVEHRVGIPTVVANPFSQIPVASRVNLKALSKDAPSLMIACGLALRSFDSYGSY